ncbi:MFS transporter [Streptomyces cinereospinus]|uniref:MFS transporter n=1 Tax=Streptomyces cinereospinus TaxID=285561 RepID=A0ABV5N6G6_9ACTN
MHPSKHRSPWLVVIGSGLAQTVAFGPLLLNTFGLFLLPITDETGWSRSTASIAFTCAAVGIASGTPLAGRLLDRFAFRLVLIPAWILYAVAVASIAVVPRDVPVFYLPFFLAGFFAGGTWLPLTKVVLGWFDNKRGTAIGLMAAIGAVGTVLTPILARFLIDAVGWRQAYAWMALVAVAVSLTMILTLVRVRGERSVRGRLVRDPADAQRQGSLSLPGLSVREALAGRHFWMIAVVLCVSGMAVIGIQVNVAPMMTDEGLTDGQVTSLLSIYALASLAGRIGTGVLLDRVQARYLAAVVLLTPVAGMFLLQPSFASSAVGMALVGVAFGMEIDLLAFLVSRYLGMRWFGSLLGMVHCAVLLSSAFGPLIIEVGREAVGDYRALFPYLSAALVLCSVTALCLGPYRYPAIDGFDQAAAAEAPVPAPPADTPQDQPAPVSAPSPGADSR